MSKNYNKIKNVQNRRQSLGRGLSSLISGGSGIDAPGGDGKGSLQVRIGQVIASRFQPRTQFNAKSISELAASIKAQGLIQPLLVRQAQGGRYELICGERRLRAAKEAGLSVVPVVIREIKDTQALQFALIENLQREDLNPIDEANGYKELTERHGLDPKEIGESVGRNRTTIINVLRLLELDGEIRGYVSQGLLSAGHARALLAVESKDKRRKLAKETIEEGLSVRQIEQRVYGPRRITAKTKKVKVTKAELDPNLAEIVHALERALGTKVEIRTGKRGGRIEIHYYSLDEFERIMSALQGV